LSPAAASIASDAGQRGSETAATPQAEARSSLSTDTMTSRSGDAARLTLRSASLEHFRGREANPPIFAAGSGRIGAERRGLPRREDYNSP
jgi:hypothetical protein